MSHPHRALGFVLAASDYGPLIVNRFDRHINKDGSGYGVGGNGILVNAAALVNGVRPVRCDPGRFGLREFIDLAIGVTMRCRRS